MSDGPNHFQVSDLIRSIGENDFLEKYWSKQFLAIERDAEFAPSPFSWQSLNELMTRQKLDFPRIRLMKNGILVQPETYHIKGPSRRDGSSSDQLDAPMINFHLRDGATLIVSAADEMSPKLAAICRDISKLVGDHASVNIYVTFGSEPGFPPHWDDHEVIIIQLEGSKHWQVFEPARKHPLLDDVEGNLICPEEPIYDHHTTPGDFLYIPRGFWHKVIPNNVPSMHLTFGINPPTALDWARHLVNKTTHNSLMRENIPIFSKPEELRLFRDRVVQSLCSAFSDSNIDDFIKYHRSRLKPRTEFSFPMSVEPGFLDDETRLEFASFAHGGLITSSDKNSIFVAALDRDWEFDISTKPLIEALLNSPSISVSDLADVSPSIERGELEQFLGQLLNDGFAKVADL